MFLFQFWELHMHFKTSFKCVHLTVIIDHLKHTVNCSINPIEHHNYVMCPHMFIYSYICADENKSGDAETVFEERNMKRWFFWMQHESMLNKCVTWISVVIAIFSSTHLFRVVTTSSCLHVWIHLTHNLQL